MCGVNTASLCRDHFRESNIFTEDITRDGDRFLEQTPFWFLPWGCPLFQVRHTHFEFPATFGGKMQKCTFLEIARNRTWDLWITSRECYLKTNEDLIQYLCRVVCIYHYVAGNSNWECPTWRKGHPHGKNQNGVCSRYLSPSLESVTLQFEI